MLPSHLVRDKHKQDIPTTPPPNIDPTLILNHPPATMPVTLIAPQRSALHPTSPTAISYTGSPLLLCYADLLLFLNLSWLLPGILFPATQWRTGALDELYPSLQNLHALALHTFLIIFQSAFLLSLPFLVIFPMWVVSLYFVAIFSVNWFISFLLNGTQDVLLSTVDLGVEGMQHASEQWIFLNGVSVGKHWLQSNLNRLALTFRRPITGVHNRTYGIIFDIIQCIIERDFYYATADMRRSYVKIKASLLREENEKVVLLLHSQGGIEGSIILDWLLAELPHEVINKLEIYTFGSAANHFNNPPRHANADGVEATDRNLNAVRHIEHYASDCEFVARWGVLYFARIKNRYMGRIFVRSGSGHLLNQHYMNAMFPLDDDNMRVQEHNHFMDMEVTFTADAAENKVRNGYVATLLNNGIGANGAIVEDDRNDVAPLATASSEASAHKSKTTWPKVKDFSRLWLYRNGGMPHD